jgi:hypothetical protein
MSSIATLLQKIATNITNKVGRINKTELGDIHRDTVESLDAIKQDKNISVDYDVTATDVENGYVTIQLTTLHNHIKIARNGVIVRRTSFLLNTPELGQITFESELNEGELITYWE